jgi:DNA repair protein RecO (recombination protein O)
LIDRIGRHPSIWIPMPGSFKTEGVVLRSIRYGEADRILHLYTPDGGRVNAIAKGSRRPKSRFGGRLEPFFRLDLMLHEGRSDLCTVTAASTVDGYPNLRSDGPAIDAAARACDAVLRLLDSNDPNRPAYNLLCRYLALLDHGASPGATDGPGPRALALAFRLKLALAAGFSPELGACARCGEREGISAFSGAAGGVVCSSCEAGGFPISAEAHQFMVAAIGRPIAELPAASESALRQVERAIGDILAHHAHVNLRAVA